MNDPLYAEVAVPVPLFKTYHYSVPPQWDCRVTPGCRVLVPFGQKLQTGIVLERAVAIAIEASKVKPILQVLDPEPLLSMHMIELARWIADYYLAPIGEALRICLPPGLEISSVLMVQLTGAGLTAIQEEGSRISPQRRAVLELIRERGTTTVAYLQRTLKTKSLHSMLTVLQSQGWLEMFQQTKPARVQEKRVQTIVLTERGRDFLEHVKAQSEGPVGAKLHATEKQWLALQAIAAFRPPLLATFLKRELGVSPATLQALARREWIAIEERVIQRRPIQGVGRETPLSVQLTPEQKAAFDVICSSLQSANPLPILLHGVTGSGKTEVYVRAAKQILAQGGQALVLVPEIGLTPAALQIFRSNFCEQVALLHSGLGEGERHDEWMRVKRGEASLVVGTRSAIFAPLANLKLIVIDEEHDGSYKQDETPRYHAREVAIKRAAMLGATLVLASATPAIESYTRARSAGDFTYVAMTRRILERPLATAEIVDMQEEFLRYGPSHTLSAKLRLGIESRLQRGQQALLLLNRRGFAPSLLCRSCGFVLRCDECSVAMTYHQQDQLMLCHHCNRIKDVPQQCPQCHGGYIHYLGEGTERLLELIKRLFPGVRVDRMDSDTTSRKGSYFRILKAFAKGETQVLIGTQMIAKGHDFPNVTLAGVVAADQALGMPDFRAAERTFQLLTQVAGRSGRGETPGEVIVQTRFPNHYSLKYACQQNYASFYQHELEYRRSMAYPPFTYLANLICKGTVQARVLRAAEAVGGALQEMRREMNLEKQVRILGPNPAPLERIKGNFRFQILLKSIQREDLLRLLRATLRRFAGSRADTGNLTIDLDPLNLL